MKKLTVLVLAFALGSFCLVQADEEGGGSVQPPTGDLSGNGPPIVVPPVDLPEVPEPEVPELPDLDPPVVVPEFDGMPEGLADLLATLKAARDAFVAAQEGLAEIVAEQREAIREAVQENLAEWRAAQQDFRTEMRERAAQLREELQNNLPVDVGSFEGGRP
jgi:hypothetical protein